MASKKFKNLNIDDCLSCEGIDSELSLVDDVDEQFYKDNRTSQQPGASGQLSFDAPSQSSIDRHDKDSYRKDAPRRYLEQLSSGSSHGDSRGLLFEVSSARIVKQGRDKYVTYSLSISNGRVYLITSSVTIEKRYSDFEKLNSALQKKFPHAMKGVAFPKKILTGNFKDETIAQRSRAFEQFLSHICAIEGVTESEEFQTFLFKADLSQGLSLLFAGKYQECGPVLEVTVRVQEKILSPSHPDVIFTLCAIAAACNELEEDKKAEKYCQYALHAIDTDDRSPFLVALLHLAIRLSWKLEKSKHKLELWLSDLQQRGVDTTEMPKLLDILVRMRVS